MDVDEVFKLFLLSKEDPKEPSSDIDITLLGQGGCQYCDSTIRVVLDGVWTCAKCHTVIERLLDYGAEWRVFQNEEGKSTDMSRCSAQTSDLIAPLGCVMRAGSSCAGVGSGGVGSRSRSCRSGVSAVMMSKHQSWNALTYRERSLCKVFDLISARTAIYDIAASIVQEAKQMYKQVSHGRIFRGDSRIAVIAACVYMALRSSHVPRSIGEVANMFEISSRSAMIRGCNLFHTALPRTLECSQPGDFVARFCCRLGMSDATTTTCKLVAQRVDMLFLVTDCTPPSVVGAVIQLVNLHLGLGIKRETIADVCIVSSGTIARCCRRLSESQEDLFDSITQATSPKG